jgi:hypothetical protein
LVVSRVKAIIMIEMMMLDDLKIHFSDLSYELIKIKFNKFLEERLLER